MRTPSLLFLLGTLACLGYPGFGLSPLFFAAYIGFAFVVARQPTLARVLLAGLAWGAGHYGLLTMGVSSWGLHAAIGMTLLSTLTSAIPAALWIRYGAARLADKPWLCALRSVCAWGFWRLLTNQGRFPITDANAITQIPWLVPAARLIGADALSGLLVGACMATGVVGLRGARLFPAAVAATALLAFIARVSAPNTIGTRTVAIPQLALSDADFASWLTNPTQAEARKARLTKALDVEADLLVTTEGGDGRYTWLFADEQAAWRARHRALLLSAYDVGPQGRQRNSVFALTAEGALVGEHVKAALAPYGEGGMEEGPGFHTVPLLGANIGVLICLESLLHQPFRELTDANLFVATVSDGSFGAGLLAFGHLATTVLRSVESGRDMVWASNAGPTALITRWGSLVEAVPFGQSNTGRVVASLYDDTTPFQHAEPLIWIALLVGLLATQLRRGASHPAPIVPTTPAWITLPCAIGIFAAAPSVLAWIHGPPVSETRAPVPTLYAAQGGVAAYFLGAYGRSTLPNTVPLLASLDAASAWIAQQGMHTRRVPTTSVSIPALLRADDGEWFVLVTAHGAQAQLFSETRGFVLMTIEELHARGMREALIPARD